MMTMTKTVAHSRAPCQLKQAMVAGALPTCHHLPPVRLALRNRLNQTLADDADPRLLPTRCHPPAASLPTSVMTIKTETSTTNHHRLRLLRRQEDHHRPTRAG